MLVFSVRVMSVPKAPLSLSLKGHVLHDVGPAKGSQVSTRSLKRCSRR